MNPVARIVAVIALAAALGSCKKEVQYRVCEACIEKEGAVYCGKSATNTRLDPDVTVEQSKVAAGKAACREYGARKGGGYNGPPFKTARDACAKAVTLKDLRRTRCDEQIRDLPWNPKDGLEEL